MSERSDSLIGHTALISAFTMLSRVLGLVRDCLCAAFFGAGLVWDAFSFAFRVPNLFRRLFGEGALSAAFVPLFSEQLELRGRQEAWRMSGRVAGALTVVLLCLLVMGEAVVIGLPRVVALSARWELALRLTAVMLPYMVLICLTALASAGLQSLRHFAAPALAPVVLNVCWIVAVAVAAPWISEEPRIQIFVVAGAIVIAGGLQLGLQLAILRRKGWRPFISFQPLHPQMRRIAADMAPVALGMAAFQINVLLDSVIAISLARPEPGATFSLAGATVAYPMQVGANSVLYYAGRLMQVPLGVFGIALATAAFPTLSRHAAREEWDAFSASLMQSLGLVIFIGVPAGVGLIAVRRPAVEAIFQRGAFTPAMTARTAGPLLAYCTGIWAYCALHVLSRAFYSLQQPATPARVAAAVVGVNLALNLALVWPLGAAGLAAATAVCAALQVGVLWHILGRRVELSGRGALLTTALKTCVATVPMWFVCRGMLGLLPELTPQGGLAMKILRLLAPVAAGLLTYVATAALLRTRELHALVRHLLRTGGED